MEDITCFNVKTFVHQRDLPFSVEMIRSLIANHREYLNQEDECDENGEVVICEGYRADHVRDAVRSEFAALLKEREFLVDNIIRELVDKQQRA